MVQGSNGAYEIVKGREEEAKALGISEIDYLAQVFLKEYGDDLKALGEELEETKKAIEVEY
jgi:hypothetical protein